MSADGRSPSISSVKARAAASLALMTFSSGSSIESSSASRPV